VDTAGTASAPAVVLMGYGNLGRELCTLLEEAHVDYLCIDGSLDNVAEASRRGHRVRFAHVDDPASLDALGIAEARLVAVAHESLDYAKRVLQLLRDFHPGTRVSVAVSFLAQRDEVRAMGFDHAFAVVPEGALIFGRSMLDALGVEPKRADQVIESLRSGEYAAMRPPPPAGAAG
jgi:voltage-gated potassium channel Kch